MAGIYLHIPFCKQACHYCNFHFSTSLNHRQSMTQALVDELALRADYLDGQTIQTIYFGGGTPSLLPISEIEALIAQVYRLFPVADHPEVTLEANPDDMTEEWFEGLKTHTPVNRLSIGVQSFHEPDLRWMNRAHQAAQSRTCIERAQKHGFHNLTIDLIYGAPTTTDAVWADNVQTALDYGIPHLSCYALTVEEGTALHHFVKKGKTQPVEEAHAARQFEYLMAATANAGYDQYEISNFALPGFHAIHNSSYWLGAHYLGIGPSAHSYNGHARQWNVANNARYLKGIEAGTPDSEAELLTAENRFNEYLMTMLRTHWGCDMERLRALHPEGAAQVPELAAPYLNNGCLALEAGVLKVTTKGKLLADRIASDLFLV